MGGSSEEMVAKEYINMGLNEFLSLNTSQLKKAVGTLRDVSAKRYKRLKEKVGDTQATMALEKSGGLISTKGKTLGELRKEFIRAKTFLEKKTSSVSGYQKMEKAILTSLKTKGIEMSPQQYREFWGLYEQVKELDPMIADKQYKYKILEYINSNMNEMNSDDLVTNALNKLRESYEMSQSHEDTEFWENLFDKQR